MTTETCANCGHLSAHHTTNYNVRTKRESKTECGQRDCPCKKFVPQNQSLKSSAEDKDLRKPTKDRVDSLSDNDSVTASSDTLRGIFDVSDLDKEILSITNESGAQYRRKRMLKRVREERQRIKLLVEKVLDEFLLTLETKDEWGHRILPPMDLDGFTKELKKRLGI